MVNDLYWVSAFTYAVLLLIILVNDIKVKKKTTDVEKAFRVMVEWVIFFCLQDTFWGLCENGIIKGDRVFFAASAIFHISTVVTTFLWLNYVLVFLGGKVQKRKNFLLFDGLIILFEVILLIANFFEPVLFRIVDGEYVTGPLRPFTFLNQYLVYIVIAAVTLVCGLKEQDKDKERYFSVFLFELAPIMLGVFQLLFPDSPFYSLGYFLGCFIVHIFVVTKDREEINRGTVIKSIASTFYSMHLVDIENDSLEVYLESDIVNGLLGDTESAQQMIKNVFSASVTEDFYDAIMSFVDLSTLSVRMGDRNAISFEFIGKFHGWTRVSFICVEKSHDKLKKVMLTTQIIDSEKKAEFELLFKSNNDELTGLYNRRAFESDLLARKNASMEESLVFVSMDVNGLKTVNDTMGHVAGDELLKGAAECMKQCLGPYGRVYRTGGDEFAALIFASPKQLEIIKSDFSETVSKWKGEYAKALSISTGYVTKQDLKKEDLNEMTILADKRMYESKAEYYKEIGVDRRSR